MKNMFTPKLSAAKSIVICLCFLCAASLAARAQPFEKDATDYFNEGKTIIEAVYAGRTNTALGSYAPIELRRQTLELAYNEPIIKKIDEAIAILEKAKQLARREGVAAAADGNSSTAGDRQGLERNASEYLALGYSEKAQFITNKQADFKRVTANFDDAARAVIGYYDARTSWMKSGYLIAAELRALVAQNEFDQALKIFQVWQTVDDSNINLKFLKKQTAVPAMTEAFDLTGNFNHARSILLAAAFEQIRKDAGKFVPANHEATKLATKAHLRNVAYAAQIPPTDKMLLFQRARRAGALFLKGNPSAADAAFIIHAPDLIALPNGEIAPLETKLFAAKLKLQSASETDKAAGLKIITEMLQKNPNNVAALAARGFANHLKNDFARAETDLSAAIKLNPFLAFFNDAFSTRALVYRKLGKPDLAAADEKQAAQFKQALGMLAAP